MKKTILLLMISLLVISTSSAFADYNYWRTPINDDFADSNNYNLGHIPTASDDGAVYDQYGAVDPCVPVLTSTYPHVISMLVQDGGNAIIGNGGSLELTSLGVKNTGTQATLTVADGGYLDASANIYGAQVYDGGLVDIQAGGVMDSNQLLVGSGALTGGKLNIDGTLNEEVQLHVRYLDSDVTVGSTGVLNSTSQILVYDGGSLTNNGTINSGDYLQVYDVNDNGTRPVITNNGDITVDYQVLVQLGGKLINNGNLTIDEPTRNQGIVVQNEDVDLGTVPEFVIGNGGVLSASTFALDANGVLTVEDGGTLELNNFPEADNSGEVFRDGSSITIKSGGSAHFYDGKGLWQDRGGDELGDTNITIESDATIETDCWTQLLRHSVATESTGHLHGHWIANAAWALGTKGGTGDFHVHDGGLLEAHGAAFLLEQDTSVIVHPGGSIARPTDIAAYESAEQHFWDYINGTGYTYLVNGDTYFGTIEKSADADQKQAEWSFTTANLNGQDMLVLSLIAPPNDVVWQVSPVGTADEPVDQLEFTTSLDADEHLVYYGPNSVDVNGLDIPYGSFTTSWQQDASTDVWFTKVTGVPENNDVVLSLPSSALPQMGDIEGENDLDGFDDDYHWRVDEVNSTTVLKKGDMYTFDIAYITIDDFEDYADDTELSNKWYSPYDTVQLEESSTGYIMGAKSLECVYYEDLEADFVRKMYDVSGYPSDIDMTDLTMRGANNMRIRFKGASDVYDQQLSLILSDGSNTKTIDYTGGETLASEAWYPQFRIWDIALTGDMNSVDLQNVQEIKLRLPGTGPYGGQKSLYIDNIRLYTSRCVDQAVPEASFDGDCVVDMDDIGVMKENWLEAAEDVTPTAPAVGPIIYYTFDQYTGPFGSPDTNVPNEGTLAPAHEGITYQKLNGETDVDQYTNDNYDGTTGFSINFDSWRGENSDGSTQDDHSVYLVQDVNQVLNDLDGVTISMWIKGSSNQPLGNRVFCGWDELTSKSLMGIVVTDSGQVHFQARKDTTDDIPNLVYQCESTDEFRGVWNHYAFVKDAANDRARIYQNGVLIEQQQENTDPINGIEELAFGGVPSDGWGYDGRLDEIKIYDYALSPAEVAYEAEFKAPVNGGVVSQPLMSPADVEDDGKIDLKDLAGIAETWGLDVDWP